MHSLLVSISRTQMLELWQKNITLLFLEMGLLRLSHGYEGKKMKRTEKM